MSKTQEFRSFEPGIYYEVPDLVYHNTPVEIASNSGLKPFDMTEAHFETSRDGTISQGFGSAYHIIMLEPDRLDERVIVAPTCGAVTGSGGRCSNNASYFVGPEGYCGTHIKKVIGQVTPASEMPQIIITQSDYDDMRRMRDVLMMDTEVEVLLRGSRSETAMIWRDERTGITCKGKMDHWQEEISVIVDLKTTANATRDGWPMEMYKWSYHTQAPFYLDGLPLAGGPVVEDFVFIAQEKTPPYAYGIHLADSVMLDAGRMVLERRMDRFNNYLEKGDRPASARYTNGVESTTLKPWMLDQIESQSE